VSDRGSGSGKVEESVDGNRTSGIRDDGQLASTSMVMCKSQSVPDEASQVMVMSDSDVVLSPADQSEKSTLSSFVQPGQCQCPVWLVSVSVLVSLSLSLSV